MALPPVLAPPRIGEVAPAFTGASTHGPISLDTFRGHWLVFFAYPADFTPVCSSEMARFAQTASDFRALDCRLLGLSIDSAGTHAAWRASLKREFGVSVDFPILEDPSLRIARAYDMESARGSETERALFVIDPRGVVRAMHRYPCEAGRSVAEVLRLVRALQAADKAHVATPEGWQAGDWTPAVEPGGRLTAEDPGQGCVEWYSYCTQPPAAP